MALPEVRLERLRGDLELLTAFADGWNSLDTFVIRNLAEGPPGEAEQDEFETKRAGLSRQLPGVRALIGNTSVIWSQYGMQQPSDIIRYLLQEVPNLWSFHQGVQSKKYRELYHRHRPLAAGRIQEGLGELERRIYELERTETPDPLHPLVEQTGLALSPCLKRLTDAEQDLADGEEASVVISDCRRALELAVKPLANAVATTKIRTIADALGVLRERGLIDAETFASLHSPKVGLHGWLSQHGSHEQDPGAEPLLVRPIEARHALTWTRSAIELLLAAFLQYKAATEAASR